MDKILENTRLEVKMDATNFVGVHFFSGVFTENAVINYITKMTSLKTYNIIVVLCSDKCRTDCEIKRAVEKL